ncbi:MAG: cytochrome c3 family protein [candidate division Zixibacteria bacterium]|nr:cytochrome c3 family protein [candidate division Zixibacteria bacterium]
MILWRVRIEKTRRLHGLVFDFVLLAVLAASFMPSTVAGEEKCLVCHSAATPRGQAPGVDTAALALSVHSTLSCLECHQVSGDQPHKGQRGVGCGKCHGQAMAGYNVSPHVKGRDLDPASAPDCATCHGSHEILAVDDPAAPTNHKNSVAVCTKCHEDEHLKEEFDMIPDPDMIRAYESSVHGVALLAKEDMRAPSCVDCHGSHSFKPSDDPDSPVFKSHIAETCGKCHAQIAAEYTESVHGSMLAKGILESPTCTNCHGEHDIKPSEDPRSKVFASNIPVTCNACHSSETIVGKFGLKADRIATFKESFHGVAVELGETRAANCASCHGVHNIYPHTDPRSLVHKDNIQATCGVCHEGLPEDFARGTFHASATDKSSGGQFYVRQFYIWFISILIVAFVLYRILEYKRRVKRVE